MAAVDVAQAAPCGTPGALMAVTFVPHSAGLDLIRSTLGKSSAGTSALPLRKKRCVKRIRGQFVAVKRYTFARIRFLRSSSFTSFARA